MPALVNAAGNLVLGAAAVLAVRRSPAMRQHPLSWSLLVLIAFEAVVVTPVATYLFRFYPQWSLLYWFDPQLFPELQSWFGALSLLAVLLNLAAAVAGYLIARYGVKIGRLWPVELPIAVGVGAIVAVAVKWGDRILYVGDYDEFWQGNASLFLATFPGWAGLALYVAAGGFIYWLHSRFKTRDPSIV